MFNSNNLEGRYQLVKKIDSGSFGQLWAAFDLQDLNKRVAVKIVSNLSIQPYFQTKDKEEYLKEVEVMKSLTNSKLCKRTKLIFLDTNLLISHGSNEKQHYIVMPLMGSNLSSVLIQRKEKLSHKCIVTIAIQLVIITPSKSIQLKQLQLLHSQGYLHLDIKLENIVLLSNEADSASASIVRLIDFGVSAAYREKSTGIHRPYQKECQF